jgi:hypothetical protein
MAKSFLRSVTDQITGANGKTTDTQIASAITRFEDENSKLFKFKREFEKYTQAILVFDNASHRFFDYLRSLTDSTWSQQSVFIQSCIDMGRIRNEHLQKLHVDINSNINLTSNLFGKMKNRIDEQYQLQHDHDKIQKQYRSSIKRDEQIKVDRIKNELDQLRSALNLLNSELRDELPQFQINLQTHYIKIIVDLFDIHGKYHKSLQKLCSRSLKRFRGDRSKELNNHENDIREEIQSSIINSDYTVPRYTPTLQPKQTNYRILHQARAIHDYKAENEDEIDLIKDEYITVIAFPNEPEYEHDKGWEYAEKSDGSIGLFPVNFAVRLYDNEKPQ